jgi:hypothetical protein
MAETSFARASWQGCRKKTVDKTVILNVWSIASELVSKVLELIVADIVFVPDHPEFTALQLQGPHFTLLLGG